MMQWSCILSDNKSCAFYSSKPEHHNNCLTVNWDECYCSCTMNLHHPQENEIMKMKLLVVNLYHQQHKLMSTTKSVTLKEIEDVAKALLCLRGSMLFKACSIQYEYTPKAFLPINSEKSMTQSCIWKSTNLVLIITSFTCPDNWKKVLYFQQTNAFPIPSINLTDLVSLFIWNFCTQCRKWDLFLVLSGSKLFYFPQI